MIVFLLEVYFFSCVFSCIFFLRFSFTSKLKIVSIVSIVFKTSASGPNKKSFVLKNLVSEEKYCHYSQSKEKMKKADFTASLNLLYNNIMNIFSFFMAINFNYLLCVL